MFGWSLVGNLNHLLLEVMASRLLDSFVFCYVNHKKSWMTKRLIIQGCLEKADEKRSLKNNARAGREIGVIIYRDCIFSERKMHVFRILK